MKRTLIILITGLAAILSVMESTAVDALAVDIHGFISQGYLSFTDNDLTGDGEDENFVFDEVGINFGKELTDNLRVGIQLFARDFSGISNTDLMVDWAFADYRYDDWLGLRFGQIKLPHGLYNEIRDVDMLRNPIFLPESIYHELSQDLFIQDVYLSLQGINSRELYLSLQGLSLYGFIDMAAAGGLSYQALFGTQNIQPNTDVGTHAMEFFSQALGGNKFISGAAETQDINIDYKYAGNIIWEAPVDGLRIGASLDNIKMTVMSRFTEDYILDLEGDNDFIVPQGYLATVEYDKFQNWVASVEYAWNNLLLTAEIIQTFKEYDITLSDGALNSFSEQKKSDPWGWYLGASLRLTDWVEVGGYYSHSENDDLDPTTILPPIDFFLEFSDVCATARFDINQYWALKIEAHHFTNENADIDPNNPNNKNFDRKEDTWNLYAARMTVAF